MNIKLTKPLREKSLATVEVVLDQFILKWHLLTGNYGLFLASPSAKDGDAWVSMIEVPDKDFYKEILNKVTVMANEKGLIEAAE